MDCQLITSLFTAVYFSTFIEYVDMSDLSIDDESNNAGRVLERLDLRYHVS